MSIPFATFHPWIRALLGDTNVDFQLYSDAVLDAHLQFVGMENAQWPMEGSPPNAFQDMDLQQQALVTLYTAKSIIGPVPGSFSYKTPIHSVSRHGGIGSLAGDLDARIAAIQAADLIGYDGDIHMLLQLGPDRLTAAPYTGGSLWS